MKRYRKKGYILARPYGGEGLTGVSVSKRDDPAKGGWIAHNPQDMEDQWFISSEFFEENYEEVPENE